MSRIAVVGESPRVDGWALAGAVVVPVTGAEEARRAWERLPDDVEVVIVTATVAELLGRRMAGRLAVVLP